MCGFLGGLLRFCSRARCDEQRNGQESDTRDFYQAHQISRHFSAAHDRRAMKERPHCLATARARQSWKYGFRLEEWRYSLTFLSLIFLRPKLDTRAFSCAKGKRHANTTV